MIGISLCARITLIREFSTVRGNELGEQDGRTLILQLAATDGQHGAGSALYLL